MSKKIYFKFFAVMLILGLLLPSTAPLTVAAQSSEPQGSVTVDPQVLQEIEAAGTTSYWIDFKDVPDLSAAYSMDWSERGWFVYEQLNKTASASQADVANYLSGADVKFQSFWIKNTILVESSDINVLNGLLGFAEIEAIRPRKEYILYEPDKSAASLDYGINAIEPNISHVNADDVWAMGITGEGLVVANVDTGVRYTHEALVDEYRGNNGGTFDHNYNWFNPIDLTDDEPRDGNGHGTHTMGTMVGDDGGANQIGIAPDADWIACAGCPDGSCPDAALLGCGQWMAAPTDLAGENPDPDMRPNVVNNSWGDCGQTYDPWYADVIDAWHAVGTYPVFSNGNASNCGYSNPPGLNTVGNPARSGNVSGVGASGTDNGQYATFSNWGPTDNPDTINPTDGFSTMKPQFIAPGTSIRSSTPGSDSEYQDGWSGTSMAAPHVTGLVALIWQAAPCLVGDYATTENLIEETAVDIVYNDGSDDTPTNFPNFASGWGEIDALAAVEAAAGLCGDSTLQGTVTDSLTLEPLPGAMVEITSSTDPDNNRTVYTNASGTYSAAVYADTYDITVTKFGYTSMTATGVVVESEATVTQDFALVELATAIVSGIVYDGGIEGGVSHGYPLYASLTFAAPGFSETFYTDPFTGEYEVELYLGQEYAVSVAGVPMGYETLVETFTPDSDPIAQDYTLYLPAGGCSAPGYEPDYDFFWNFEQDDGGFVTGGTTSFAWGDFTNGPGEGHSGTKGLATNPSGNYNASELGWIESPAIDLSGYGTDTPAIQWWDWKHIESVSYDWARLDVTKDSGATWDVVWGPVGGVSDTAFNQQTVALNPSYNVADFQFRFYFKSDSSIQYEGWYIDDVGIIELPVPAPTEVFATDFDTDDGGFTVSGVNATWEWGVPTTGPEAAYSGPYVWATNLAGNYNNSEASYLTSPVIDLSSYSGLAPTLSFVHWMDSESNTWDWGAVEVTKDGGATWDNAWEKFGDVMTWTPKSLQLDSSYAVSDFQFRFFMRSDSSVNYPGWYIDDVAVTVSEPVVIAPDCVVIPGGVVAGFVYDDNSLMPLVGADVISADAAVQTIENASDPANEGLYWVFQPTIDDPEDVEFTASMVNYSDDVQTVSVVQNAVTQQDFYLGTGYLLFDPTSFEVTMGMEDAPHDETLTISNDGSGSADFELFEKDGGYQPLFGYKPEVNRATIVTKEDVRLQAAEGRDNKGKETSPQAVINADVELILDDGTVENNIGIGGTSEFIYLNRFTPDPSAFPFTLTDVQIYFDDTVTAGDEIVIAVYENTSGNSDPAVGSNLLMSLPTTVQAVSSWNNYTLTEGVLMSGPGDVLIGVVAMETPGVAYFPAAIDETTTNERSWAGWWSNSPPPADLALPPDEEWTLIDAYFPGNWMVRGMGSAGGGDVVWLSEEPVSGTVDPDGSVEVTVTLDPSTLEQPGDYLAELLVQHNTPYVYENIDVTLHLTRPATWGTLKGTVYGLEACDLNPMPVEGATIEIYDDSGTLVANLTSGPDGEYSWSIIAGTYDIEVSLDGYETMVVEDLELAEDSDLVTDVELRLLAPCLTVDPESMEQWLGPDLTATQVLSLVNTGAGDATFELFEMPATGPAAELTAEQVILDPSFEEYTPNPYWDEYSATYGTPLCIEADCGLGTGTGPNTGLVWSWFGGAAAGDTGYVSQEVVIPPGEANMNFFVEQAVCGDGGTSNYLALLIDDVELWRTDGTDDACDVLGYREINVDVSAYADGSSHVVKFNSVTVGNGNFFIDDITLNVELGGDVPWLSEDPISGTVDGDSTLDVDVNFDATGLEMGDYYATLKVNNPPASALEVPVTLHVIPAPEAFDQTLTTPEDVPLEITLEAVDPEGDPLTYMIVDEPMHGTLEYDEGDLPVLTYVPDEDYYGMDSFTFKATDGVVDSNIATVSIEVTSVNYPPQATDDYYEADENTELVVPAPGVLENDTDDDPLDTLIADLLDEPEHGLVVLNKDGSFSYTPDEDFLGEDSFTYNLLGLPPEILGDYVDTATVYITVNTKPVADDQSLTTNEDTPLDITLTADYITPGPQVWTIVTQPENGSLSGTAPDLVYTPDLDWYGTDSFTFQVNDGMYDSNIATITIEVIPVNDGPQAVDDYYETDMNVQLVVEAPGVLENDSDADPTDQFNVDIKTEPVHGDLVLNADGSFTYMPDTNFFGVDSFEYFMLSTPSRAELYDTATVYITVHPLVKIYLPITLR
ncbi:MAG: Ig-like domain-containing protein [Brevefilum sp.]|nr:Ig-like domain-containing protein [Brevefilum sp.]